MFDIGWSELLIVGVVALIVVGPKELPRLFRTVGQFVGKARGMAREFQRAMNRAADEAGVDEVKQSLQQASKATSFGFDDIRKTMNSSTLPDRKPTTRSVDAAKEHADNVKAAAGSKSTDDSVSADSETSSTGEISSDETGTALAGSARSTASNGGPEEVEDSRSNGTGEGAEDVGNVTGATGIAAAAPEDGRKNTA